jgi:two-component sensor histidine kinase
VLVHSCPKRALRAHQFAPEPRSLARGAVALLAIAALMCPSAVLAAADIAADEARLKVLGKLAISDPETGRRDALAIFERSPDASQKGRAALHAGNSFFVQSRYPEAQAQYKIAEEWAKKAGDLKTLSFAYNNIANVAKYNNDFAASLAGYLDAMEVYRTVGDYESAMRVFNELISKYDKAASPTAYANALNMIGEIHIETGDIPKAVEALDQAARTFMKGDDFYQSITTSNLGDARLAQGAVGEARRLVEQALVTQRRLDDSFGVTRSYEILARVQLAAGDLQAARAAAERAVSGARKLTFTDGDIAEDQLVATLRTRAAVAARSNDWPRAYATLAEAETVDRKVRARSRGWALSLAQARFGAFEQETAIRLLKQEQAIAKLQSERERFALRMWIVVAVIGTTLALLAGWAWLQQRRITHLQASSEQQARSDAARLGAANAALTRVNEQKSHLLQEIHHRVRNNLQVIASLISLEQRRMQKDVAAQKSPNSGFEQLLGRVQTLNVLQDQLRLGDHEGLVAIQPFVETLGRAISSLHGYEQYVTVQADPVLIPYGRAHPIGLILHELLTNAMKYGEPTTPAGGVRAQLAATGEHIELAVADHGPGLTDGVQRAGGLGNMIVESLVEQLGGTIERLRTVPNGPGLRTIIRWREPGLATA